MGALPELTTLAGWLIAFAVIVGGPLVVPLLVVAVEAVWCEVRK